MDRLSVMRAYCRLVERRSFSKAAEDIGVSAALLSKEIKLLEQSLGCTLLIRTTRKIALTEHGETFYRRALKLLDGFDQLEDDIRADAKQVRGEIRINAPLSFSLCLLSPHLPDFIAANPEIRIKLSMEDRIVDTVEGGFDVSIRVRPALEDSSLFARPLGTVEQALYASPDYLRTSPVLDSPEDLNAHRILAFTLADHTTKWELHSVEGVTSVLVKPYLYLGNSLFVRDMLIASQGVCSLPDFIANPCLEDGSLVRVLPAYALPSRTVFAVTPQKSGHNRKVDLFITFLEQVLRQSD